MLKHVARGLGLALLATMFVVAIGPAAQAKGIPADITEAAKTMKCKGLESYDADKPVKAAAECHLKGAGKHLGAAADGRTDILKFKTKKIGKDFWSERLAGCGECFIVNKGKLWIAGGGGYEQDIAEYVQKKLGGKVYAY